MDPRITPKFLRDMAEVAETYPKDVAFGGWSKEGLEVSQCLTRGSDWCLENG